MARYDLDLLNDPLHTSSDDEGEGEAWMVSYLDVMTLLIAFFVLLISLSEPKRPDLPSEAEATQLASESATPVPTAGTAGEILPDQTGLLPASNALLPGDTGRALPQAVGQGLIADDEALISDSEEQFSALQDSFNALSLQGVDATPGREGLTLRIADNLLFASGEAELSYDGMILLSQLQDVLAEFAGEISIEGHTDSVPINTARFPSNWELSSARAIAVLRYLEFSGMTASRMRAVGYADTRPLQDNSTAQGRAANRRVELILREL